MLNGNRLVSRSFKKVLIAATAVAAVAMGSGQAYAAPYPVFTFDPTIMTNGTTQCGVIATCGPVQGDRISGSYYENFQLGAGNTFTSSGFTTLDLIAGANDATLGAGVSGDNLAYRLFATYFANGTYTIDGTGEVHFFVNAAGADLYADGYGAAAPDTAFDTDATGGYAAPVLDGNDVHLATAGLLNGDGEANGSTNASGNFGITFNPVSLTDTGVPCSATSGGTGPGCAFFTGPRPFYIQANFSGQFINFNLTSPQALNGTADLIFQQVPEPATLTMLGVGLIGLARRRYGKKSL